MSGSQSSFSQFRSLSGFQKLHFICNSFWLQTFKQLIIDSETWHYLFPSFYTQPSNETVLFDWNLSKLLFLDILSTQICCCAQDQILNKQILLQCLIFTRRPMNHQYNIEQSNEQGFSTQDAKSIEIPFQNPSRFHFSLKKIGHHCLKFS